jgi:hypothetical protein
MVDHDRFFCARASGEKPESFIERAGRDLAAHDVGRQRDRVSAYRWRERLDERAQSVAGVRAVLWRRSLLPRDDKSLAVGQRDSQERLVFRGWLATADLDARIVSVEFASNEFEKSQQVLHRAIRQSM